MRLIGIGFIGILAGLSMGCAYVHPHATLEAIRTPPAPSAFSRAELILVKPTNMKTMRFIGDKQGDQIGNAQEQEQLRGWIPSLVAQALRDHGFHAEESAGPRTEENQVTLESYVTLYDRGSGAARSIVALGAGASHLYTTFQLRRGSELLADFDLDATSGHRGGVQTMGGMLRGHIEDTALAVGEFLQSRIQ